MPVTSTIITLLIFTIIVVVHEYGHFIVARKNGILVEEFAVGLGPKVIGWQRGETLFTIRAIPLGGYCKMLDGDPDAPYDKRAFNSKKVWQRISVCLAGAVMNFLLAMILGAILFSTSGEPLSTTTIYSVQSGSPAEAAGIMPGDRILRIGGSRISSFRQIGRALERSGGEQIDVVVRRDGNRHTFPLTAEQVINEQTGSSSFFMGVVVEPRVGFLSPAREYEQVANPIETMQAAWMISINSVANVVEGLSMLVRRQVGMGDMFGPIGIGQVVEMNLQAAVETEQPVQNMLIFGVHIAMVLSASLAVLNLLPIPALDGGRIIFLLIEGIRRKPMPPEKEGWIHLAGFVLVMGLAVVVAFNDVLRIIG